ncbi:MAG: serine hydrolase domain-containing protein [Saprospiraceae bacterium]
MKDFLWILTLAVCLFSCNDEENNNTQPVTTNNPLATRLDSLVHADVLDFAKKKSTAGLSIGILRNGQTHFYGYGETVEGNGKIPNENTIFEIGSISKTFTASALALWAESKSIALNTPINQFLPATIPTLSKDNQKIELLHLLNHTSGLPRLPNDIDDDWDPNNPYAKYDSTRVYNYLKTYQLSRKPGALFEYSNLGMGLAGRILEREKGMSYEQLIKQLITQPLGMTKTKMTLTTEDLQNAAQPHDKSGKVVPFWDWKALAGAGALKSTAKDMLLYAQKHLAAPTDDLGKAFQQMRNTTYSGKGTDGLDYKIGLAWFELTIDNQQVWVHDGGTGGSSSFIFICPAKNLAMVFLSNNNTDAGAPTVAVEVFNDIIKL